MKAVRFTGAKVALLVDGCVIAVLRDDIAGIPWPGYWDLPGGGREGDEAPAACALREVREELGLNLPAERLRYARAYPSTSTPGTVRWFFGAHVTADEVAGIVFGDEGQEWRLMPAEEFIGRADAVPYLRERLWDWVGA